MTGPQAGKDIGMEQPQPWTWGRVVRWVLGLEVILLLALAQVMFAGYRLGVGNQSIQIPFLKHWIDPTLYANDPMVKQTLADYPSFFFRLLATIVNQGDLYSAYFWLHVLTCAAVLAAAYGLGKAIFDSRASGIVLVLLMLAGHHHALAGDDLYSLGFTHTWAVFPLAIWAMLLFYRQWYWAAFALVGVIFNLHALTAGYLLVMFLAWAVVDYRPLKWRSKLAGMLGLFFVIALPTLIDMLSHRQHFGPEWLERTRIRSADHSFPSSWWTAGAGDVPRFVLLMGLAALSLSFGAPARKQRKSLLMAAGVGVLFLIGWVFSDIWPLATVVRAQLFRSSRLLVVLMLAHVAHGIVRGWHLGDLRAMWRRGGKASWQGSSDEPFAAEVVESEGLSLAGRVVEALLATATFLCIAIPGLFSMAPWLLLATLIVALANGRLGIWQAVVASVALLVVAAAQRTIEYHVPGIDGQVGLEQLQQSLREAGPALWVALGVGVLVWVLMRLPVGPRVRLCFAVAVFYVGVVLCMHGQRTQALASMDRHDAWVQVQLWAAKSTPREALFLTPPQQGGFRIYSDRSVVCEWRDGTQLYFSADFAKDWWNKLTALRPVLYDSKGTSELMHGKTLEKMDDREVVVLAKKYGAGYVVLPAGQERELKRAYANGKWTVYEPRILDAQDAFIENVAKPNIEKYRKSDARLELTDAEGRTITEGNFQVRQTRQAFGFGVSLPFFGEPAGDEGPDGFAPPPVTPKELALVKDVFNYTVIPFSAKWQRIEPVEGERHYEELDRYVDWCVKNGLTIEFHYLSGFTPRWVMSKSREEQKEAWLRHCRQMVDRYHDRIKYWQVMNDGRLSQWAADAFREIRAKYPDLKLGVSNCSKFYSPYTDAQAYAMLMQGSRDIEQLQAEGVKIDFFSSHGHKPNGAWPDMRQVYECLDEFAKYGVKIHVSEATLDLGMNLVSRVHPGDAWTPELAADFFERYYTVLFSHPDMEAINYWDLSTSLTRPGMYRNSMQMGGTGQAGLLDPANNDAPRPLYYRLKELIRDRWMTRLSGEVRSDGVVAFRGFHGDYEIAVRTPSGKLLKGKFSIEPDSKNQRQVKLVEDNASVASGR
jgi:GH35 family endo-1,4-beta-xylanase